MTTLTTLELPLWGTLYCFHSSQIRFDHLQGRVRSGLNFVDITFRFITIVHLKEVEGQYLIYTSLDLTSLILKLSLSFFF